LAPIHRHSTPLLEKLHWLPISERIIIKYKVACMCFSAVNGSGPACLSKLLHVYTPSCTLCSSDTRMLKIQQYKCKSHGFCAFSCFGLHIWNSLPQDLNPIHNWANGCSPNILQTVQRTMIHFLTELLVHRT